MDPTGPNWWQLDFQLQLHVIPAWSSCNCQKTGCNWSLTGLLVGAQALPVSRVFSQVLTTSPHAGHSRHGAPLSYNGANSDTVPSHYDTVAAPQQHGDSDTVPARYDTIVRHRLAMTATRRPATTTPMPRRHGTTATRHQATATPTPRRSNTAPARYDTDTWRHFATTATRCPATDAALQQHGDSDTVPASTLHRPTQRPATDAALQQHGDTDTVPASTLHRHTAPSHYDSDTAPCHYDTDTDTASSHYNTERRAAATRCPHATTPMLWHRFAMTATRCQPVRYTDTRRHLAMTATRRPATLQQHGAAALR
ncbi:hypothetical protein EDB84DRAFT_1678368 [Lactarius hengduanensis]|nr:hypothetical protein EDB84DRAFT_1678368 [Lactarius hengduanensis]